MAALFVYIFGAYFSSSFIGIFVSVVLLLSLDFWTVKNVTGRIMVRKESLCFDNLKSFITTTTHILCVSGWSSVVELHKRRGPIRVEI